MTLTSDEKVSIQLELQRIREYSKQLNGAILVLEKFVANLPPKEAPQ
jgi:hypothetical protein